MCCGCVWVVGDSWRWVEAVVSWGRPVGCQVGRGTCVGNEDEVGGWRVAVLVCGCCCFEWGVLWGWAWQHWVGLRLGDGLGFGGVVGE